MTVIIILNFLLAVLSVHYSAIVTFAPRVYRQLLLRISCYFLLSSNCVALVAAAWKLFRVLQGLVAFTDPASAFIALAFYLLFFGAALFAYLHYQKTITGG